MGAQGEVAAPRLSADASDRQRKLIGGFFAVVMFGLGAGSITPIFDPSFFSFPTAIVLSALTAVILSVGLLILWLHFGHHANIVLWCLAECLVAGHYLFLIFAGPESFPFGQLMVILFSVAHVVALRAFLAEPLRLKQMGIILTVLVLMLLAVPLIDSSPTAIWASVSLAGICMVYTGIIGLRHRTPIYGLKAFSIVVILHGTHYLDIYPWLVFDLNKAFGYILASLFEIVEVGCILAMLLGRIATVADKRMRQLAEANAKLAMTSEEMELLATRDQLTGIYNRRKLEQIFRQEIERHQRFGHVFSIVISDIDHFKAINDTAGHNTGDAVLVGFASVLQESVREVDVVGRWGGEEFVIVCPETDIHGAVRLSEKLRAAVEAVTCPQAGRKITASFGVAMYREGDTISDLIGRADRALYSAKTSGRNRVAVEAEAVPVGGPAA